MKIKQTSLMAILAASVIALVPAGRADETNSTPKKSDAPPAENRGGGGGGARMSPEGRLKAMTESLTLTADQQAKIKPLLEAQAKEFAGFRDLSQDERRAKMRTAREEMGKNLKPILTEDQYKKWEAQGQRGPRGGGAGGGTPPADAPKTDATK